MGGFNDYSEDKILDHVLGGAAFPQPTPYLGLWIGDPGEPGTGGAEVSSVGTGYLRQTPTFAAASGGIKSNSVDVVYPVATAAYGTLTHAMILDQATLGNPVMFGQLTNQKTIDTDDQFRILATKLVCTLD